MVQIVEVSASPKQISRLRNGHKVRVKRAMAGEGICLVVSPINYDQITRTFSRNKGLEISLSPEELKSNQMAAPDMEGKGIFSKMRGKGSILDEKFSINEVKDTARDLLGMGILDEKFSVNDIKNTVKDFVGLGMKKGRKPRAMKGCGKGSILDEKFSVNEAKRAARDVFGMGILEDMERALNPNKNGVSKAFTASGKQLASDLIHQALPEVISGLTGAAASSISGNPAVGLLASQTAGRYAGRKAADALGQATGYGMKKPRKPRAPKMKGRGSALDAASLLGGEYGAFNPVNLGASLGEKVIAPALNDAGLLPKMNEQTANFFKMLGFGLPSSQSLADRLDKGRKLDMINAHTGANLGIRDKAAMHSAVANQMMGDLNARAVEAKGKGLYAGSGLYAGASRTGGAVGLHSSILPPAMRSQPFGANFQFQYTLPPNMQNLHRITKDI